VQDDYIPEPRFAGTHLANGPQFIANDAPFHNYNTSIDFSDNLTKIWASHTLKTGIYLQRSRKDQTSFGDNNGYYNFGDTPNNPFDTGYGYSKALPGVYQTFDQASVYINGMYRYWNIEGFIQDTWVTTPFDHRFPTSGGRRPIRGPSEMRAAPGSAPPAPAKRRFGILHFGCDHSWSNDHP
jgi:hypothetical protein